MSVSHQVALTDPLKKARAARKSAALMGPANDRVAGLVDELVAGWQHGEQPLAEEFIARCPEYMGRPDYALRLIYEEICQRYEAGLEVTKTEMFRRFPQWRPELEILLSSDAFVVNPQPPTFPMVGEEFEGFWLLVELGRGGQGRVFLAQEAALAGRPVVLKITAHDGQEHLSLARLQHTYIVPLYWARDVPSRNLRILCMPYLGGATLAKILEVLKDRVVAQRTGQDLISALDQIQAAGPNPFASFPNGPVRQFLARQSFVRTLCWIASCLAEALNYAHERGLVHLDLKPSNVLLAADGQPMLLDFNLSQQPLRPADPMPERFGGTVDFMSPEQKEVMAAFRKGKSVPAVLDGRSDIYSLGLVLYEALGGNLEIPECESRRAGVGRPTSVSDRRLPPLHRCNPTVPQGFSDIIDRCVEADPSHRYANAGLLAADLRRHLADLPLQGVANRSFQERWQKWRRRRPYALVMGALITGLLAALFTAGLISFGYCRHRLSQAEVALNEGREHLQNRNDAEAVRTLARGLALTEGIPGSGSLTESLRHELIQAQRARLASDLHFLADRMRFLIAMDSFSADEVDDLDHHFRSLWDAREQVIGRAHGSAESDVNAAIRTDMLDMAILGAHLRVRSAPVQEKTQVLQEALKLLAQAEAIFGPSPVLYRDRQTYAEALGRTEIAQTARRNAVGSTPQTAWEYFALGLSHYRGKDFPSAGRKFQKAVDLRPQDFWPHFYLGKCAFRLDRFSESLFQFSICIALAPDTAESYYNRALVQTAQGHSDLAMRDYDLALERNPKLAAAALNRGILYYGKNRLPEAFADLRRALDNGADPAVTLYNLALVQLAQGDRRSAAVSLQQALRHNPGHKEAQELRERLQKLP